MHTGTWDLNTSVESVVTKPDRACVAVVAGRRNALDASTSLTSLYTVTVERVDTPNDFRVIVSVVAHIRGGVAMLSVAREVRTIRVGQTEHTIVDF